MVPQKFDLTEAAGQTTILRNRGAEPPVDLKLPPDPVAEDWPNLTPLQEYLILFFGGMALVLLAAFPEVSRALNSGKGGPEIPIVCLIFVVLFRRYAFYRHILRNWLLYLGILVLVLDLIALGAVFVLPRESIWDLFTGLLAVFVMFLIGVALCGFGFSVMQLKKQEHVIEMRFNRARGIATVLSTTPRDGKREREFRLSAVRVRAMEFAKDPVVWLRVGLPGTLVLIAVDGPSMQAAEALAQQIKAACGQPEARSPLAA
jgi:hypothetical protein